MIVRNKHFKLILLLFLSVILLQCRENKKADSQDESGKTGQSTTPPQREEPKLVYDSRGNVIERHSYSYRQSDGSIRSVDSYYYEYDDRNNVIKEVKESYELDKTLKFKNINYYSYNEQNLQTEIKFESYNSENQLERRARHTFRYNKAGHKIEDIGYYEDGNVKSRIILDPDETGALRSEEYIDYNEKGIKTSHKKYYYSQFGLERTEDLMNR